MLCDDARFENTRFYAMLCDDARPENAYFLLCYVTVQILHIVVVSSIQLCEEFLCHVIYIYFYII